MTPEQEDAAPMTPDAAAAAPACPHGVSVTRVVWVREFAADGAELGCEPPGSSMLVGGVAQAAYSCNPSLPAPADRYGQTVFRWTKTGFATERVQVMAEDGTLLGPPEHVIVPQTMLQTGTCSVESWHWISVQHR